MRPSKWIEERSTDQMVMFRNIDPDKAVIEAIIDYLDMKYEEEHGD